MHVLPARQLVPDHAPGGHLVSTVWHWLESHRTHQDLMPLSVALPSEYLNANLKGKLLWIREYVVRLAPDLNKVLDIQARLTFLLKVPYGAAYLLSGSELRLKDA